MSQWPLGFLPIEDGPILETREMIYVSVILVAIIMWNLIVVWQIRSHTTPGSSGRSGQWALGLAMSSDEKRPSGVDGL